MSTSDLISSVIDMEIHVDGGNLDAAKAIAAQVIKTWPIDSPHMIKLFDCLDIINTRAPQTARHELLTLWYAANDADREIIFWCATQFLHTDDEPLAVLWDPTRADLPDVRDLAQQARNHANDLAHAIAHAPTGDDDAPIPDSARLTLRCLDEVTNRPPAAARRYLQQRANTTQDPRARQVIHWVADTYTPDTEPTTPDPAAARQRDRARAERPHRDTDPADDHQRFALYGSDRPVTDTRTRRGTTTDATPTQPRYLRDKVTQLPADVREALSRWVKHTNPSAVRARRPAPLAKAHQAADRYFLAVQTQHAAPLNDPAQPDELHTSEYYGYSVADEDTPAPVALTLPCVACHLERLREHTRTASQDDGLCPSCRAHGRPGIPAAPRAAAYLDPRAAAVHHRCAWITQHYPSAAPGLLAALAAQSTGIDRAAVTGWTRSHATPTTQPAAPTLAADDVEQLADRARRDDITREAIQAAYLFPYSASIMFRAWYTATPAARAGLARAKTHLVRSGLFALDNARELTPVLDRWHTNTDGRLTLPLTPSAATAPETGEPAEQTPSPATRQPESVADWSPDELTRLALLQKGRTVVVSMREGIHPHLIDWATRHGLFVPIDRTTALGNPFHIGRDGDRPTCVTRHAEWLATQPDLIAALPGLRGKALGCWCAPEACHGDTYAYHADNPGHLTQPAALVA